MSNRHCCSWATSQIARARIIGDVVDGAAERIDFKHRLALGARQDAHRGVERAARSALRAPVWVRSLTHPEACATAANSRRPRRRDVHFSNASALRPATAGLPRWTCSLSGSRRIRIWVRRCARRVDHRRFRAQGADRRPGRQTHRSRPEAIRFFPQACAGSAAVPVMHAARRAPRRRARTAASASSGT